MITIDKKFIDQTLPFNIEKIDYFHSKKYLEDFEQCMISKIPYKLVMYYRISEPKFTDEFMEFIDQWKLSPYIRMNPGVYVRKIRLSYPRIAAWLAKNQTTSNIIECVEQAYNKDDVYNSYVLYGGKMDIISYPILDVDFHPQREEIETFYKLAFHGV